MKPTRSHRKHLFSLVLAVAILLTATLSSLGMLSGSHKSAHADGVTITEFPLPTSGSQPYNVASGPDGNIWFTLRYGNSIGRIMPNGTISEFPIPTSNSSPFDITAGPDGNMWFTEYFGNKIGRISPNG